MERIKGTPPMNLALPRIYCASPYPRAKMWRARGDSTILGPDVAIISTWHLSGIDECLVSPEQFAVHWIKDFAEIRCAHALLAYAEFGDKPQGTLVEIGYALAHKIPVHIVGNYNWATWKNHPSVTQHATLREAVVAIIREQPHDAPKDVAIHGK
jgi:hypothetical protein